MFKYKITFFLRGGGTAVVKAKNYQFKYTENGKLTHFTLDSMNVKSFVLNLDDIIGVKVEY